MQASLVAYSALNAALRVHLHRKLALDAQERDRDDASPAYKRASGALQTLKSAIQTCVEEAERKTTL
jgi:hypothetical protein